MPVNKDCLLSKNFIWVEGDKNKWPSDVDIRQSSQYTEHFRGGGCCRPGLIFLVLTALGLTTGSWEMLEHHGKCRQEHARWGKEIFWMANDYQGPDYEKGLSFEN